MTLLIADVSSPDGFRRNAAIERLMRMQPIEGRRIEISRALENAAQVPDGRVQQNCFHALGTWGDADSATFILARLSDPNFRARREAIDAVKSFAPGDPRLAAAIGAGFDQNARETIDALLTLGPAAAPEFLKLLERPDRRGVNPKDLINHLGTVGTSACIPAIEKEKATSNDGFLKGDADKAIAAIKARESGNDPWLMTTTAELKAKDDNRRREAIRRLSTMPPAKGPTPDVSRALEVSLDDPDIFLREALLKAVELWGDDSTIAALTKRAAKPDYRGWELALSIIARRRPDDPATIDLVCSRAVGERGDLADPALKILGARAESKLLAYATGSGPKNQRNLALRALGIVGTPASLDSLKELTKLATVEQVANAANDALNAIKARH
jgi:HEAT repeat protein